ncbi:MAG: carboxypeptidase regulatory-like domain-containing protein [Myxococcaceae bacterium]
MNRKSFSGGVAALSASFLLACSGGDTTPVDAGVDASFHFAPDAVIRVSGTAAVYPNAAEWMTQAGMPVPSLKGLTLRIEEPLKVALGDDTGVFGSTTLDDTGAFSMEGVDTGKVNLGIAVGIRDEANAGTVIHAATTVWDVQMHEAKPELDIRGATGWALPKAFHDALTLAVSPVTIAQLSGGTTSTLSGAGFILGKVVDAQGSPVAGARIVTGSADVDARFFYPSEDFSSVTQAGTSASGLFVYVHDGGTTRPFTLSVDGKPDYKKRNGGVAAGTALIMTVYPGTVAP